MNFDFETKPMNNSNNGITLDLDKGVSLDLTKKAPTMTNARIGVGWDMMVGAPKDADLDVSALLFDSTGQITNVADVVFYNNPAHSSGAVKSSGDNRTGEGEGDDESILIDFTKVPSNIVSIVIPVTIHEAETRQQTFGLVQNAFVNLYDDSNNTKLATFNLTEDYSTDTAIITVALNRTSDGWSFNTIGDGLIANLNEIIQLNYKKYF